MSPILIDKFDVVGVATNGWQAVDMAHQVDPDVIVLDVNMPGLDGFQTFRALKYVGVTRPVVFLSVHESDEYVDEAFRCGARGYVLKSRAARDLASAIDQALFGRVFVPSLTSLFRLTDGGGHAMQLYRRLDSFLDGAAAFLDLALRRGDATCVVATQPFREGLGDRLRSRGWAVGGTSGHKRYLAVDAGHALNRVMVGGRPDPNRVAQIATQLDQYRLAFADSPGSRLTAIGNMVVSLIGSGNERGAIALESLWDRSTKDLPIFTLCCYATSCFHDGVPGLWSDACSEHWVVGHAREV
jgi:CheY-like chemotaxis protein